MPNKNDVYFEYLDWLRESGKINMYGAPRVLENVFSELDHKTSMEVFKAWCDSFEEVEDVRS